MVRSKQTMGSTLVAVAVIAAVLAAPRIGPAPGIVVCVLTLAWKRTSDGIASGLATSFPEKAALLGSSVVVAAAIVGLSNVAFLLGYYGHLEWEEAHAGRMCGASWSAYRDSDCIIAGVVTGAIPSLCVATLLRKMLWPIKRAPSELGSERRPLTLARFIKLLGIAFSMYYVAMVAILVLLKATLSPADGLSWTEVVYGPAITVGSCFLLVVVGLWVEHRIRRSR